MQRRSGADVVLDSGRDVHGKGALQQFDDATSISGEMHGLELDPGVPVQRFDPPGDFAGVDDQLRFGSAGHSSVESSCLVKELLLLSPVGLACAR